MGFANPIEAENANLRAVEWQCAERLANARALRDFAREIEGLDAPARAMLRAGIEELTKRPGA